MGELLVVETDAPTLASLAEVTRGLSLDLTTASADDALDVVRQTSALEALVVGAPVPDALLLAQRVYRVAPALPVVFLIDESRRQGVVDALRFAPFVGDVAIVSAAAAEELHATLRDLVVSSRRKREHARTLAALDARLTRATEPLGHRRGAEILGLLLEKAPVGVVLVDEHGVLRGSNQKASDILGVDARELLGASLYALFPEGDAARCREMIGGLRRGGESSFAVLERRRGGEAQHIDVTAAAFGTDEEGAGCLLVLQDATERVRNLAALEEAVRVRDEFVMIASHELKTPLTALHLQIDRLVLRAREVARDEAAAARLDKSLATVRRQVARLEQLVDELLAVSRAGQGVPSVHLEDVDLTAVTEAIVKRLHDDGSVKRSGSTVSFRADGPVIGRWDPALLEQIVTNLLTNALKYGASTEVRVIVAERGRAAALTVADDGIGIAPEAQARIFEKFERAVSARHYSGFGIGLFTVKRAVDLLGGAVNVASAEGEGATFEVVLPRDR